MSPFEHLDQVNRTLIQFAYYDEQPDGELADSYFERLDDALSDGFLSPELLGEARVIIERLTEIIKLTSDRVQFQSKVELSKVR